jgi:Mn2+/Fe2+ NRAMP family transporter
VDLILHAGDITGPGAIAALERIAPVQAVRGDHDRGLTSLPLSREVMVEGRRIVLVHGNRSRWVEEPQTLLWTLSLGYVHPNQSLPEFLHRKYQDTHEGKREAIRFATIDSSVALMFALFINAAMLIMAAAVFHGVGHDNVADIGDAYVLLSPLLGTKLASVLFAVALLCSGQNATLTGTLAGQIVMEGFINLRIRPWLRRLITRLIAIIPAVIVVALYGEKGTGQLLILSQVILSLQLSFAVFPLVIFTNDPHKMGSFANSWWIKALAWPVAFIIAAINAYLLWQTWAA